MHFSQPVSQTSCRVLQPQWHTMLFMRYGQIELSAFVARYRGNKGSDDSYQRKSFLDTRDVESLVNSRVFADEDLHDDKVCLVCSDAIRSGVGVHCRSMTLQSMGNMLECAHSPRMAMHPTLQMARGHPAV